MKTAWIVLGAAVLVGSCSEIALDAAETGDFDGDGRLTIADVSFLVKYLRTDVERFAEGSLSEFEIYPCYDDSYSRFDSTLELMGCSVLLESLRRTVDGALSPWNFQHWPTQWLDERKRQAPLVEDPRIVLRVLGGEVDGDAAILRFELETEVEIRAFLTIVEHQGGVLRTPWLMVNHPVLGNNSWQGKDYGFLMSASFVTPYNDLRGLDYSAPTPSREMMVAITPTFFLASGGRYVMAWGLRASDVRREIFIAPGRYDIRPPARIARGTEAGNYQLDISEATQFLLADGSVVRPRVEISGELVIPSAVETGWDGDVPPLEVDEVNQVIGGTTEFRFVDGNGNPAEEDGQLLIAVPGEEFTFGVQVRTTTPLNLIHFEFTWPEGILACTDKSRPAFVDEIGGEPFIHGRQLRRTCGDLLVGRFRGWFYIGSNWSFDGKGSTSLPDRPMAYFEPLGEWLDLFEVTLMVTATAPNGSQIPLAFRPFNMSDPQSTDDPRAEFAPYRAWFFCRRFDEDADIWPARGLWKYDIQYHDAHLLVKGEAEEPIDLGLRVELGNVSGRPGSIVRIPVFASASEPLLYVRLAVEYDPDLMEIEGVETWARSFRDDEIKSQTVMRQSGGQPFQDCIEDRPCDPQQETCCWFGEPLFTDFYPTDSGTAVIDWVGPAPESMYPGREAREIAQLVVRIREDAPIGMTVTIRPAVVEFLENGSVSTFRTGGSITPVDVSRPFSPANEAILSEILITNEVAGNFRRGDANFDQNVNLSDAIYALSFLFLTGESPRCMKAADVNDDGDVNISDPVFLLSALFLGGTVVPPPSENCDEDPTPDLLSCNSGC